jgi:hypothetical protein
LHLSVCERGQSDRSGFPKETAKTDRERLISALGAMEVVEVIRGSVLCGVLVATIALMGAAAAQRIELPAGPNREIVARECQACHGLDMVVGAAGLSREGWTNILAEMSTYGMNVTPDDQGKIVDHLSTYLGPR